MKNLKKIIACGLVVMTILGGVLVVGQEHTAKGNKQEVAGIDPPSMAW